MLHIVPVLSYCQSQPTTSLPCLTKLATVEPGKLSKFKTATFVWGLSWKKYSLISIYFMCKTNNFVPNDYQLFNISLVFNIKIAGSSLRPAFDWDCYNMMYNNITNVVDMCNPGRELTQLWHQSLYWIESTGRGHSWINDKSVSA